MRYDEPLGFLGEGGPNLLLFGGKGGVGKTTVAASLSLYLSDISPRKRFLVISTDPAHSLSDSLDFPLSSNPRPIYGRDNLWGLEIDAQRLFAEFLSEHGQSLRKIIYRGTYLDDEDASRLLELSFPGLDEVMAMIYIMDLLKGNDYDMLIVDTAPTGHTLRLLALPVLMETWVSFLDTLMKKHRYMCRIYTRRYRRDDADDFIIHLTDKIRRIQRVLQDEDRCRFVVITLAEPVVLFETQRLLEGLAKKGVPVKEALVNKVIIDPGPCDLCRSTAERQRVHLEEWKRRWPTLSLSLLPSLPREVRGEERLRAFAELALSPFKVSQLPIQPEASFKGFPAVGITLPSPDLQFFLLCGKGGVGKTTLACSFALNLSRHFPEKRTLLFSTDPAHSLSDCLEQRIWGQDTPVADSHNLFAVEIDPEQLFKEFRHSYAQEIQELFDGFVRERKMDIKFDREVLTNLMDLSPPGLDELMALSKLVDYIELNRYELYVLDTAPTGHTLRFLDLTNIVQDWLRALFDIILKYRNAIHLPRTSELLVNMSKKAKKIQQILSDPGRCQAIPVAIPTEMALRETERLVSDLNRLKIPVQHLFVNMVVNTTDDCRYCDSLAGEHEAILTRFRESFPHLKIVTFPQRAGEIKGIGTLEKLMKFH